MNWASRKAACWYRIGNVYLCRPNPPRWIYWVIEAAREDVVTWEENRQLNAADLGRGLLGIVLGCSPCKAVGSSVLKVVVSPQ